MHRHPPRKSSAETEDMGGIGGGDAISSGGDVDLDYADVEVLPTRNNFRVFSLVTVIILLLHLESNDSDNFALAAANISKRFKDTITGELAQEQTGTNSTQTPETNSTKTPETEKRRPKRIDNNPTMKENNTKDGSKEEFTPIAICFMGQPRAKSPLYWRTMYSRLVEPIREHTDVFFAFSNGNSFGTANPDTTGTHGEEELKHAHDLMKPKAVKAYVSSEEGLASRGKKMFWKDALMDPGWGAYQALATHFCHELITAEEKKRGAKYKFVIKTRADLIVEGAMPPYPKHWPDPATIPPTAWVPTIGNCGANWAYSGDPAAISCVNDHFAILTGGWAARAYLQGIFEDYTINHNVSKGALEVPGQGSCPECWVGLALSRRGVYKKLLANYMPEILWRSMHPPNQDKLNGLLEPLFGGAPDFPEIGKCDTQQCAEAKCAPVVQRVPEIKFAAAFCQRLARSPPFVMELIPPSDQVVECVDSWNRRPKVTITKNSNFGQHGHASCGELGLEYIPA